MKCELDEKCAGIDHLIRGGSHATEGNKKKITNMQAMFHERFSAVEEDMANNDKRIKGFELSFKTALTKLEETLVNYSKVSIARLQKKIEVGVAE